jgi:hypothetical protein
LLTTLWCGGSSTCRAQSWHHGKESDVTDALGADPADVGEWGDPLVTSYRGGRLFFMDAHGVPAFLEAFKYEEASPSPSCFTFLRR